MTPRPAARETIDGGATGVQPGALLSCTSWSFPACTLPEVAGIARALGIGAVDVGLFYAASLDRAALLERVPGLRLTLDYAHFICLGYRQEEIDPLAAYAAHVHLRQARPGALQAKLDEGTINFAALLGTLRECGYGSYLALEYVHQGYMNTLQDDVLTETVRLRDLVRAQLDASAQPRTGG